VPGVHRTLIRIPYLEKIEEAAIKRQLMTSTRGLPK
jgi:hypothetical protein